MSNLYSGSQEPQPGGLIYADLIKALMRGQRDPHSTTGGIPYVIDDYLFVRIITTDSSLKVRHKLLKLTSYDQDLDAWFVTEPDETETDIHFNSLFAVYHEKDYAILIGEKPVRVNTELTDGLNVGDLFEDYNLSCASQILTDPLDSANYCLVVRGVGEAASALVHCEFVEFGIDQPETAYCLVTSSTIKKFVGDTILVLDVDGKAFNETEAELIGRLVGASLVWYEFSPGYLFQRWEAFTISCPDS